jgi:hypothetical protein
MNSDDLSRLAGRVDERQMAFVQKGGMKWQRLKTDYPNEELRSMPYDQQIQHFRDSIYNALAQAAIEGGRGQPPMIDRFRAATNIVDRLVLNGVPFGVGRNSRMNKELRKLLNEDAQQSLDSRKSRRKQISADATRRLLRDIKKMRLLGDFFIKLPPYSE